MALIYELDELSRSGLIALQSTQRDWSPYLVHFTSGTAMAEVNNLIRSKAIDARMIHDKLVVADKKSFDVFKEIVSSSKIECRTAIPCKQKVRNCVSLSECSLPGVINHSERYGRFGFVFEKNDIYKMNGRPCQYLDQDICSEIGRISITNPTIRRMNGFANTYMPVVAEQVFFEKPRDFTVEREWRTMGDIDLRILKGVLCPYSFEEQVCALVEKEIGIRVPIFPLDVLYRWGV